MVKTLIFSPDQLIKEALEGGLKLYCPFVHIAATEVALKTISSLIRKLNPGIVFVEAGVFEENPLEWIGSAGKMNFELITVGREPGAERNVYRNVTTGQEDPADLPTAVAAAHRRLTERAVYHRLAGILGRAQSIKIGLPVKNGLDFVNPRKLYYGEADGNFTRLFFGDGKMLFVSAMLKDLEILLEPLGFVRIHNSFIVNRQKIVRYRQGDGGEVELVSGKRLPVARSRKLGFLGVARGWWLSG